MATIFFNKNLKLLRNRKGLTQEQLADAIGLSRANVNNYENIVSAPPAEILAEIANYFKLSIDTLLTVDLTEKSERQIDELVNGNDIFVKGSKFRLLTTTVDSKNRDNIELVNQKAKAGYLNGHNDPEFIASLPTFQIPYLSKDKKYRMFQIEGDSMLPIPNRSYITAEYFNDWTLLKDGTPCVVVTREEGIVFKIVDNKFKNNRSFILRSLNSSYPEYEVAAKDIFEIWRMVNYTTSEIPNTHVRAQELLVLADKLRGEIRKMMN
jgi:transcriptional regulator with XRE-family HTH domain